jgi:prefoldin subunit 5
MMDVEEEIRVLEEYREALTKELEKVNKRLEALKRYKMLNSTRRPL